jgi:hypothetical protein
MTANLQFAETEAEKQAIFRHRYEIYVEEMDRYHGISDHENRVMTEDVDEYSRFLYAELEGVVIGSMRWTWGGDSDFVQRHIDQYMLQPFLDCLPPGQLIVGERFMVSKEHRGSDLLSRMFVRYMNFCNDNRIQLVFGDCEPHLLNLYQGLGFRTYSERNINSADAGYLIPLVLVPEDLDYMQRIKSPITPALTDFADDHQVPENLDDLIKGSAVLSERLARRENYWEGLHEAFHMIGRSKPSLFDDLDKEVIQPFLNKSNVIDCKNGDRVLKKGNVAQNMFVVLSGELEVRENDQVLARLVRGDLLGEVAFFLGIPRSADVYAVGDNTSVLSLSETTVRKQIDEDPKVAAQMMLNISRILCQKLVA